MELLSFIVGVFIGAFSLHILYITYFHMFILWRIEGMVLESRRWVDNYIENPPYKFPIFDPFTGQNFK